MPLSGDRSGEIQSAGTADEHSPIEENARRSLVAGSGTLRNTDRIPRHDKIHAAILSPARS
jgi:hypothetical protein